MKKIRINLDKKRAASHDICIGRGILDRAGLLMAKGNWGDRCFVVSDSIVAPLHGEKLLAVLAGIGLKADLVEIPAGESSKSISAVAGLAGKLISLGADRRSLLVALGGGVVGDICGFTASVFMRGIPYVQLPTSLIAMVDSSIGGKTGVDLPSGKNLLGSFYQPKAVFMELDYLKTLPPREVVNGMAEIIKYGVIDDPELFDLLESDLSLIIDRNLDHIERIVAKAVRIKKGIVEIDETEMGLRRILNFGHTIGHAVEAESGFTVSHGHAVGLGILGASLLSEKMNYLNPEENSRIASLIRAAGLPVRLPAGLRPAGVLSRFRFDKKKEGGVNKFVLLKKIGMPFVHDGVSPDMIGNVIQELAT
ncbi:MAG TPA: 3-dehydroquinate synthase [Syntrophales bacterium]|nr:3-dehydroquinate synthase [Syntrophales bacterium]